MPNIAYLTFAGAIPSRTADAVCVMNMCGALAARGARVELIIPGGQAARLDDLHFHGTLWDFYGLPENFSIRYLPAPCARFRASVRKHV